jgi:ribonuclease P protein component
MLKKEWRIRRNKDFRRIYRAGKAVPGKYLVVFKRENGISVTRFGFSISKKFGKAVVRNRRKRILREITRKHMDNIRKGYDIVVVSRLRNEKEIKFADLEKDFLLIMKRAGLLEGSLDGNIPTGNNHSS